MSIGPRDGKVRLLADIGGTNARFGLLRNGEWQHERVFACDDYPDLVTAVESYLESVNDPGLNRPEEAAMAIAGPITNDFIRMTNHVWQFSVQDTRRRLQLNHLIVMNDFTALAMAVRFLPAEDLEAVGAGRAVPNTAMALIGPGTGLGVSGLIPHGEHWIPLQGEGGHVTLPVMTEREIAVLAVLRERFSHVSAERVISGPGLVHLYEALCVLERSVPDRLEPEDITQRAAQERDLCCREAVSMFCALLGTVAGNLVLTLGALGGLYIGGGIVPQLGRLFSSSAFRDRFEDKGRYADYLSAVPIWLIRTKKPAFYGLARAFMDPGPRLAV